MKIFNSLRLCLTYTLLISTSIVSGQASADAWLDNDPGAIWKKYPGVYKEDNYWYVIFHAAAGDTNVRLQGDFTNGATNSVALTRTPDGKFWWFKGTDSSFSRAPKSGDGYRFSLERKGVTMTFPDPASRWQSSKDIKTAMSKIYIGSDQAWSNPSWTRAPKEKLNIYQLHAWRFTGRNSGTAFEQVREELDGDGENDYINRLGNTAIEFLPINDFTSAVGWGYNPNYYYAIEHTFGGPEQFKSLVDTAHQNGIEVILDLVFNHVSHNAGGDLDPNTILSAIDRETYIDGETQWGAMYNFDNDVAKHFLIQNVLYLAREFKITGFRFDMTNLIWNEKNHHIMTPGSGGGWLFLRELYGTVKAYDPNIWFTFEEFPDWFGISSDNVDGTQIAGTYHGPTDSKWVDIFHDNFKATLVGGGLEQLRPVFSTLGPNWSDGTIYTESHDEVGNTNDRIALRGRDGKGWEMNQISAAGTILARGTPMVFMGQEAAEERQFDIHAWKESDRLNLTDYQTNPRRQKVAQWFARMNQIRNSDSTGLAAGDTAVAYINDGDGIAAFTRDNGKYLIVLNFKGNTYQNYDLGISGRYVELANTSWPAYNLNNYPLATRGQQANQISDVAIPAYGAVVLQRVDGTYNQPPVVVITPSQPVAKINTNLTLSAAQSTDADGTIANYLWTTGETTPSISVRYTKGGFKSVGVTVTDNGGAKTTAYTTIDIDDGIPRSTFPSLNFRGSANGWSNTPMSLIANNLWSAPITFVGQTEQSFKFDVAGDWINTYGDSNADGIVERMGGDIRATVQGNYFVRLNDATMKYSLVSADNENKPPVAVITPKTPVVGINQTLTLSAQDSSDPDGQIVSYLWSTGESTPTINISYPTGGFKTLSVTVTDNGGYRNTISTTVDVDDGSLRSNFTSLNFRGTANNWLATPMTLTSSNLWIANIYFDGQANQRFKFDLSNDWKDNYGDSNADGTLDKSGSDILTTAKGNYRVQVNDKTLRYELISLNTTSSISSLSSSSISSKSASTSSISVSSNSSQTSTSSSKPATTSSSSARTSSSSTNSSVPGTTIVKFSCQNGFTYNGQSIYVIGNRSEIGNWNTANAVKLDPTSYPTWTGSIALPSNTTIEWKCLKRDERNAYTGIMWEGGSNNVVNTGTELTSLGSF